MESKIVDNYESVTLHQSLLISKLFTVHYFEYMNDFSFPGEAHNFWEFLCVDKGEVDVVGLAKLMVGRNVDFSAIAGRPPEEMGKNGPIMQIKGLGVKMPGENVKGVDIDIHTVSYTHLTLPTIA